MPIRRCAEGMMEAAEDVEGKAIHQARKTA